MSEWKLNLLLMGKTGHGKSATGNSLLMRNKVFETSSNVTSETKDVKSDYSEFGKYTILVVDGPGLQDTDMSQVQDKEAAVKNMATAIAKCYDGVDAFIFVLKFGEKFTREEKSALEALKGIFGERYMDYVIVVVTCGDLFRKEMDAENDDSSFDDWCRRQAGDFSQLYNDCKGRFVLFNNREKNEDKKLAQVQQIVKFAHDLQRRYGRYTSKCFEEAAVEREKLILKEKAPILKEKFQEKLSLLSGDIERFSFDPSSSRERSIRNRIRDIKKEIQDEDKGHGILKDLLVLVEKIDSNLKDVAEIQRLDQELQRVRNAKQTWTNLGVAGTHLASNIPYVGLGLATLSLVVTIGANIKYGSDEAKLEKSKQEIQNRKKM